MQHHGKQKQAQNRAKSARSVGVKDRSGPRFSNTDASRSKRHQWWMGDPDGVFEVFQVHPWNKNDPG